MLTDLNCLQGNQPAYTTTNKVQMQGAMNYGNDSKAFKALASTQESELSDKTRKDKKKKQHKEKRNSKEFAIPATGINIVKVGDKKRKMKKNKSEVIYFNCNKKEYYANKCQEFWKSKN